MEMQWELMVFTLFVCLGAGIFAIQGLLSVLDKGEKIQLPALITSLVCIVVGGIGSFLHLQHWERIFNGFGHLTSGITQELIGIVVFVAVMLVYFFMLRRSEDGKLPKWCGILAIVISAALIFVMAHSYNMSARPVWDTPLLWLYYWSNAFLFGCLAVGVIAGLKGDESAGFAIKLALIAGIVQAVITVAYAAYFTVAGNAFSNVGYYFDPVHPTKEMVDTSAVFSGIFTGENALLFWLGVVVVGLIIPLVVAFLGRGKNEKSIATFAGIGLVAALIGGMCFRIILYILGFSVFVFF